MPSEIKGIVLPHKKVSRLVTEDDLQRVYEDAERMHTLCNRPIGIYRRFYAIAHPQCVEEDPLRFFVLNNPFPEVGIRTLVIINPVIIRHTNSTVESEEGCASFATMPANKVERYNKCEVEFSPLEFSEIPGSGYKPFMGKRVTLNLSGKIAKIFQHEIQHLDAKYIYDF